MSQDHQSSQGDKRHVSAKLAAFGKRPQECDHETQPALVRRERRTHRNPRLLRPMRFVSLHHHSTYSYLDGFQLPDAHARRAAELNMSALAMTEHGNVMSHAKFEAAVAKPANANGEPNPAHGIKPIFGVELYTGATGPGDLACVLHTYPDQQGRMELRWLRLHDAT